MERLRRRFFKAKNSSTKPKDISPDDEEGIYLEPQFDEISTIGVHIDVIAEEILTIAKKSVRMVRYCQSIEMNLMYFSHILFVYRNYMMIF